jgi:hypothetical protein
MVVGFLVKKNPISLRKIQARAPFLAPIWPAENGLLQIRNSPDTDAR